MLKRFLLVSLIFFVSFCYGQQYQATEYVTVPTSLKYKYLPLSKRLFLGKNYRQVWQTPVRVAVLKFSETGFIIKELGGGQQTKSLQLEDKQGKSWVLRSVDKYVTMEALPKGLKKKFARNVVQDMVSGAHPHAPLVVSELSKAIGIVAPDPVLYYVADDPGLAPYRKDFAGTLCFLEEREPTPDDSDTKNTESLTEDMAKSNDNLVMQPYLLKARLLDMLIADWDRHADQWRWRKQDSAGANYYYAIPRDRDQAFYNSKGLLISLARTFGLKHLVGFREKPKRIKNLNFKEWNFDRTFLNSLDKSQWQQTLQEFKGSLTDDVISNAAKKLPPETYAITGKTIEKKLLGRRNGMESEVMGYYTFLSKVVVVTGSNDEEVFTVSMNSGKLHVRVTNASGTRTIYQRSFDADDTKQIELIGLKGNDRFIVEDNVTTKINLVLDGGDGKDYYEVKGRIKNKIIDRKEDENEFGATNRTRKQLE